MRVESHDVRQRKVRDRRNEIDRVEGARAVDVEEHALVPDRVPRQSPEGYAGQDLDVLVVEHHGEDVAKLRIVLRADAGIHQHVLAVPFDKETVHREADSISLVGGSDLVPEHLGDDAEHGAAVQAESAARNEVDLVRSDLYAWNGNDAGVPHKPSSVGFLRGDHFSGTSVTGRLKQ